MSDISWIKLRLDMFDDERIKIIEAQPNADTILVIWMKLLYLAKTENDDGYIPFTIMDLDDLARIFDRPPNIVEKALETFINLEMIECDDNDEVIYVSDIATKWTVE